MVATVPDVSACDVSEIYQEFARQLAGWQRRYASDPEREILQLYLLALEREENVAVAYHDDILGRRLATLALSEDARQAMRRALVEIWRDEEMHTLYVRRTLLDLGGPSVRARTWLQQVAGAMGGWTVAVRQHWHWSEAPLSTAAATLLLWAGHLTGRVPRTVRRHLGYCSFKEFCRYNVDTESTAWLCWQRLGELGPHVAAISDAQLNDFRRIADDEDRHRRVFGVLADALTGRDTLRDGVSEETLSALLDTAKSAEVAGVVPDQRDGRGAAAAAWPR